VSDRREFLHQAGVLAISLPTLPSLKGLEGIATSKPQEATGFEEAAQGNLQKYGNCAQASFEILRNHYGLEGGEIVRALSPFPGVGLRGDTCGAVTGSLMALGLMFGRGEGEDYSRFLDVAAMARDFCTRFENNLGSTKCGDIHELHLGRRFDLADPEEMQEFGEAVGGLCTRVVATGVRIATEIIEAREVGEG
jgi:C_GCAxxG_C_C family probable redox protein